MGREIKFRAWHKSQNRMALVDEINFSDESVMLDAHDYWDFDDIVLMQYTGLKDKNGREIYEGDIIAPGDGRFKEVNGRKYDFAYLVGWEMCSSGDMGMDSYGFHFNPYWKSIEVLGNLYENPELLDD